MTKKSCFLALLLACTGLWAIPTVTLSKTAKAPVIDGVINEDEWSSATVITGFSGLDGQLLETDTEVLLTYDEQALYVAVRSSYKSAQPHKKQKEHPENKLWLNDSIDLRFQMEKGNPESVYLLAADPVGNIYFGKGKRNEPITTGAKIAWKTKDSGENVGGVESFSKTLWDFEMAIPFSGIGMTSPQNGQSVFFNIMRNYAENANLREKRWTSWTRPTPGAQFGRPEDFGKLIFGGNTAIMKMVLLDSLESGNLVFKGTLRSNADKQITLDAAVSATLAESGKKALNRHQAITLTPSKQSPFTITGKVYLKRSQNVLVDYTVKLGDEVFFENRYSYKAKPAFHCDLVPLFLQDRVIVNSDVQRVSGISSSFIVEAVIKGHPETMTKLKGSSNPKKLTGEISLKGIKAGNLDIVTTLKDGGKVVTSQSLPLTVHAKPQWLGNNLGISEKVPVPFTALKSTDSSAQVWGRDYRFGNGVLPEQIVNQGKPMFRSPMKLIAVTDQGEIVWNNFTVKRIFTKDTAAKFRLSASHPQLNVEAIVTIEYDGFMRYDLQVTPVGSVMLKRLAFQLYPAEDNCTYMRAYQMRPQHLGLAAYLKPDGIDGVITKNIWHISGKGWKWEKNFLHYMWMGGDESGLMVAFESAANTKINQFTTVVPTGNACDWTINLVDIPTAISKPLTYAFALQATPTKPLAESKTYHFGYHFDIPDKNADAIRGYYAGCDYGQLDLGCGYPCLTPKGKQLTTQFYRNQDFRVFPDGAFCWAANDIPEIVAYRREWLSEPVFSMNYRGKVTEAYCRKATFTDYLVWAYKKRYEDGARGLYHDGVNPGLCSNTLHDCGVTDSFGVFYPTMELFSSREMFKRIYTMYKELSPDSFFFVHNGPMTFIGTFADGSCEGESWTEDYANFNEYQFRAAFAVYTRQSCAFALYPYVAYNWRYPDLKARTKPDEILAIAMSYNCYPVPSGMGGAELIGVTHCLSVWEIMDEYFPRSKWYRFWDKEHPVKTSTPGLKAVVYHKPENRKAMLLISNIDRKNVKGTFKIDIKKLSGAGDAKGTITEIIPGKRAYTAKEGLKILRELERRPMGAIKGEYPVDFTGRGIRFFEVEY